MSFVRASSSASRRDQFSGFQSKVIALIMQEERR
jgi:hypothetical protein